MASDTKIIYVQLLDEGTDVWRPTEGHALGNNLFRLLPTANYDPEIEAWEFLPGAVVRCEEKALSTGIELVAVQQIS